MALHQVTGEEAARIRTAALDAISSIKGAMLGDSQLNEIITMAGSAQLSMSERLTRAASMAVNIAQDYAKKPINYSAADRETINRQRAAMGLPPLGAMRYAMNGAAVAGREGGGGGGERKAGSAAYGRELNGLSGELASSYKSLTGEFSKTQLNAVTPYAKQLGWNDKEGLRSLAGAGRPFAADVVAYNEAKKRGDSAGMAAAEHRMQDKMKKAKGKQKRHMEDAYGRAHQAAHQYDNKAGSGATVRAANADRTTRQNEVHVGEGAKGALAQQRDKDDSAIAAKLASRRHAVTPQQNAQVTPPAKPMKLTT